MEKKNSYQVFMEEAPEAAAGFNGLIQSPAMPDGLEWYMRRKGRV
jgi:hypothetical protein